MLCLGIETSCDETSLALADNNGLLDQITFSQADIHSVFGGVVPEMASREHLNKLSPLFQSLMERSGTKKKDIRAIAVTRGPGLLGCLLVGLGFAKGLALGLGVPLVGVNHLHAHLMAPGLEKDISFPALGILVSGGHTNIYLIKNPFDFELLGRTLDDAAGEAFDKAAKTLNIPYPGGVFIDRFAAFSSPDQKMFPKPYLDNTNLDFSFSGIKTAMVYFVRDNQDLILQNRAIVDEKYIPSPELSKVCASFNWSIARTIKIKLKRALTCHPVKSIILAGGVAANTMVRHAVEELALEHHLEPVLPRLTLCTDNAAMVAWYGRLLINEGYYHSLDLEAIPRGKKVPWDYLRDRVRGSKSAFQGLSEQSG